MTVRSAASPDFEQSVPAGGYAWWYIDAVSDDGQQALTVIAFVGSVFSPYYAWARKRRGVGFATPNAHCAINVALYDLSAEQRIGNRWTMTERSALSLTRDARHLRIGPSELRWHNDELIVTLNEIAAPVPRRVVGTLRLTPGVDIHASDHSVAIDRDGGHIWRPIAPTARVEVQFERPEMHWTGHAYLDSNYGNTPLEVAFRQWQWSRATLGDGSCAVIYDVVRADGSALNFARLYDTLGAVESWSPTPAKPLPSTRWGIHRDCHSAAEQPPHVAATLESGPFYARSLVNAHWLGDPVSAMHESLSLTRFARPIVQAMLPFRMPRW